MLNPTYKIINSIGEGQFGAVYKGLNIHTGEEVAIKMEKKDSYGKTRMLKNEANIYMLMSSEKGFPRMKWYGRIENYCYMVFDLLGSSLRELPLELPMEIIRELGVKMLTLIECLHKNQILHRDIKPDNFLFHPSNFSDLYLIDFGMSTSYMTVNDSHIPIKEINNIIGTSSFVSLNVHNRLLPSRRDDIESILYVMCSLFIPFKETTEEDIIEFKKGILLNISESFRELFNYVTNLKYEETPDYEHIISKVKTI